LIIKPQRSLLYIDFSEMWKFRELLYIFIWRDVKVRYKQTILGVFWAVFQPVITMIIFTVFFGKLAKIPSDGIPYPIFVYSGLLLWNYFSAALTKTSGCMITNVEMIKKIYFPRLILPLSSTATPLVDFFLSFVIFGLIMVGFQFMPNLAGIALLPILLLISFLASCGLGLFLASLNVKYRDVRQILPFFIQLLLFLTPVIYPVSMIPENFRWISYLNPMSGVITIARSSLLDSAPIDFFLLFITFFISITMFIAGIFYFNKTERYFADII
jgi:lipopolysaccharide transport system permease protein